MPLCWLCLFTRLCRFSHKFERDKVERKISFGVSQCTLRVMCQHIRLCIWMCFCVWCALLDAFVCLICKTAQSKLITTVHGASATSTQTKLTIITHYSSASTRHLHTQKSLHTTTSDQPTLLPQCDIPHPTSPSPTLPFILPSSVACRYRWFHSPTH